MDQAPMFYQPDLAELDRLATEAATRQRTRGQFDDIRWYNVDDGVFTFLLTPPYSKRGLFEVRVFSHFNLDHTDAEGKRDDRGVYCPQYSTPERKWDCPICAALGMLRMVQKQIQQQHPDKDLVKAIQRVEARAYTYFNAVVTTSIDLRGMPRLDQGQPLTGPLPRIVKGPPALGDFVLSSLREYGARMYAPEGAIPLKVERKRTGNNPQDVKYQYQYVPGALVPLASSAEALAAVAAGIYDLDRVLNPEKKWTEDEWKRSAAKAMEYVKRWGFTIGVDRLPVFPADLREAQAKAKQRGDGGSQSGASQVSAPPASAPGPDLAAVVQAATAPPPTGPATFHAPVATPPAAMTQSVAAPAATMDLGALAAAAGGPPPVVQQPAAVPTTNQPMQQAPSADLSPLQVVAIVRDPSNINPATGAPQCKGNYLGNDPACIRCPMLDVCMVETLENNVRSQV